MKNPYLKTTYNIEREQIEHIRRDYPEVPAMTLARNIHNGSFGTTASLRPLLSTYSVIRRFDDKLREAKRFAIMRHYGALV